MIARTYLLVLVAVTLGGCSTTSLMEAGSGALPNHSLTPGGTASGMTKSKVCSTKWGKDERHVTAAMKEQAFKSYGFIKGNRDSRCPCEVDHLISRELGGADEIRNLWPQSYRGTWNAHMKDRLENRLHKEVCAGTITLSAAQSGIAGDWTQLYNKYFGGRPEEK